MIIYKVTNLINKKVYIGQTIRPLNTRWKQHLRDSKVIGFPIYRSIRKHGIDNFKVEEIDGANSQEELNYLETHYIHKYDSLISKNGYNCNTGGNNCKLDRKTLDLLSIKQKEVWNSIGYREKMKEVRKTQSFKRYKKEFSVYIAIKITAGGNKSYTYKKGKLVGLWQNQKICAEDLDICKKSISACLINKNKNKTHKGYIFEYK